MWIFLAGLKMALNLSHYLFATVAAERDRTVITLFPVSKGDSITVSNPQDVETLRKVFEDRGLTELQFVELVSDPVPSPPAPAEAASNVVIPPPQVVAPPSTTSQPAPLTPPQQVEPPAAVKPPEVTPPQAAETKTPSPAPVETPDAEQTPDVATDAPAVEAPPAVEEPEKPSSPFLGRR